MFKAYAKINLFLKITGQRNDGYHELDSIMQQIDLYDEIEIEKNESLQITVTGMDVPEENTIKKAAQLFFAETGIPTRAKICVKKHIPEKAGLGGASADAAVVLTGLNKLYDMPLDKETIFALGKQIGADVPFALRGGCCRARGIGEALEPMENNLDAYYLLLKPKRGISTPEAFAAYHKLLRYDEQLNINPCIDALKAGDLEAFGKATGNSLGHAALHLCPETRAILKALENSGTKAYVLSGSGSTCVGIFKNECDAKRTQQQMLNWDLELNHIVRAIEEQ